MYIGKFCITKYPRDRDSHTQYTSTPLIRIEEALRSTGGEDRRDRPSSRRVVLATPGMTIKIHE